MKRVHQALLIVSAALAGWLGMLAVHETGHAVGALLTGGRVARLVLHPLAPSKVILADNPRPLVVAWAGPLLGVAVPLLLWATAAAARVSWAFLPRCFAGFCLLANGAYIGLGSIARAGDCGEMLRYGSGLWQLWAFGGAAIPSGLALLRRQGSHFGLGPAGGQVSRGAAYGCLIILLVLVSLGLAIFNE